MCLAVIGVLWAEIALAVFYWSDLLFFPVLPVPVFLLFTGFALPVIAWAYIKPLLKEYIRIRDYEYYYLRLKRTPEVIRAMLEKEPACDMAFSADEIHLGKVDAPLHLTLVLSFQCRPCIDAWFLLNRWLADYPGTLWITIRFFGYNLFGMENKELIDTLTGIYLQHGNDAFCKALSDWYDLRDIQEWNEKYRSADPIKPISSTYKNGQWEKALHITGTPTIFIGDRRFPFALEDLEYTIKDMN